MHGVRRAGHSLPELIVAVTFLASTLVAVGGSAVLGARWAVRAEAVQEAVQTADRLLDSLAALPGATSGSAELGPLGATWSVGPGTIRVEVPTPQGPTVVLEGPRLPLVPVVPDPGAAGAEVGGAP